MQYLSLQKRFEETYIETKNKDTTPQGNEDEIRTH